MRADFSGHFALLVRLLFYLNISNNSADGFNLSELEYSDLIRHKEIMTNAVVKLLLLYFKFTKRYRKNGLLDILEFENVSQIFSDNNAQVLILKMLSLWFTNYPASKKSSNDALHNSECGKAWLSLKPEDNFNIFKFMREGSKGSLDSDKKSEMLPSSARNFETTITLMRILQKVSKHKLHRLLPLVQWKSSAVLKRILKTNNSDLSLYALKLLKSQIPYLGKKWRQSYDY